MNICMFVFNFIYAK